MWQEPFQSLIGRLKTMKAYFNIDEFRASEFQSLIGRLKTPYRTRRS